MKRALLLSAYDARSHGHWRHTLQSMFPDWQWRTLCLPPRHFSWRVRGNPLFWSREEREALRDDYDVVLATSMVDLATLRGLVPELSRTLNCLYFHENQFAYPQSADQNGAVESQMVSLYSAMAADRIAFNSHYNFQTFISGAETLLNKLPDFVPHGLTESIEAKARVVPVPVYGPDSMTVARWPGNQSEEERPARVVWLGRFEYDKGPEVLLHALEVLEESGESYELALVGQEFRSLPPAFNVVRERFSHRIVHWGFIDEDADFRALLRAADVALSTALHEFQGLALIEAAAHGAIPVVPARQAYPEVFSAGFCYPVNSSNPAEEGRAAAHKVLETLRARQLLQLEAPAVTHFFAENLRGEYLRFCG